jgi:transposase InsO family protein
LVKACYFENRRRYGSRRIHAFLHKAGVGIGRLKVRRLMKQQGLKAIQPGSFTPGTTDSGGVKAAPNLLAAIKPEEGAVGQIIVGDITYIRLRNGKFCYLAVFPDKVTRRIISRSLSREMKAELVVSALKRALFVKS